MKREGREMQFFINDIFINKFRVSTFPVVKTAVSVAFASKVAITSIEARVKNYPGYRIRDSYLQKLFKLVSSSEIIFLSRIFSAKSPVQFLTMHDRQKVLKKET